MNDPCPIGWLVADSKPPLEIPEHKRGDTLTIQLALVDTTSKPVAIYQAESQVRNKAGKLQSVLKFTADPDDPSLCTFSATPEDQSKWDRNIEVLYCDVRFTHADGTVESTAPFQFHLTQGVTRAPGEKSC